MRELNFKLNGIPQSKKNRQRILYKKCNKTEKKVPFIKTEKVFDRWHEGAMLQLNPIKANIGHIIKKCHIEITFFYPDLRRRDLDNQAASIMDLLKDAQIIIDDTWTVVPKITLQGYLSKNDPYCTILIKDFTDAEE